MKDFFIVKLLRWVATKFDGYKTLIGGAGFIMAGLVGIVSIMFPDAGLEEISLEVSLGYFSAGFAAIGIGGKIEKAKEAATQVSSDG